MDSSCQSLTRRASWKNRRPMFFWSKACYAQKSRRCVLHMKKTSFGIDARGGSFHFVPAACKLTPPAKPITGVQFHRRWKGWVGVCYMLRSCVSSSSNGYMPGNVLALARLIRCDEQPKETLSRNETVSAMPLQHCKQLKWQRREYEVRQEHKAAEQTLQWAANPKVWDWHIEAKHKKWADDP